VKFAAASVAPVEEEDVMQIRPPNNNAVAWADFALVVAATVLFAILSVHFELGETISTWTHPRERYQLDELPGVLLVMALGGAWFAWRRTGEARRELRHRFVIEAELTAALSENRRLERENTRIQEEERRILARELHDELGQYLNAIKLEAVCLCNSGLSGSALVERSSASIVAIVDQVQATVRDMVRRLRPAGLDELGLAAAIEECVDGWRRRLPAVRFEYDFAAPRSNWGEAVNMTLYRLVQEGLTNVARHASARSVAIRLQQLTAGANPAGVIRLDISDDGVGIASPRASASGVGLAGMRERVESLGGRFEAANAACGGFHVVASIPVPELAVRLQ
jgi:signal transduction histidine kinase